MFDLGEFMEGTVGRLFDLLITLLQYFFNIFDSGSIIAKVGVVMLTSGFVTMVFILLLFGPFRKHQIQHKKQVERGLI